MPYLALKHIEFHYLEGQGERQRTVFAIEKPGAHLQPPMRWADATGDMLRRGKLPRHPLQQSLCDAEAGFEFALERRIGAFAIRST